MIKEKNTNNLYLKEIFISALSKIEKEENWTKIWRARNSRNLAMNARDSEAVKFSIDGALIRALFDRNLSDENNPTYIECFKILEKNCSLNSKGDKRFLEFNDNKNYQDIVKIYQKIIDSLK